jgi:hypothetical protein
MASWGSSHVASSHFSNADLLAIHGLSSVSARDISMAAVLTLVGVVLTVYRLKTLRRVASPIADRRKIKPPPQSDSLSTNRCRDINPKEKSPCGARTVK